MSKELKKIYVISKYAGDVEANTAHAVEYCRRIIKEGYMPIASHLLYPQIVDDDIPREREIGLEFGFELLRLCDEVWVFGEKYSDGMEREIAEAKRLRKQIRYFPGVSEKKDVPHSEKTYLVDVRKDGERIVIEVVFELPANLNGEKVAREYLCKAGYDVVGVYDRETHHICGYCGGIAEGENNNMLCKTCRDVFGHTLLSEL